MCILYMFLLWQDGEIPEDVFNKAMVTSAEEAVARAEKIGFPIMVKASEGLRPGASFHIDFGEASALLRSLDRYHNDGTKGLDILI